MARNEKVMPSLHLALQSGSDRILEKMNRHYTKEEALSLIRRIKEKVKDIAITTDLIVGFPGETEEDFEETVDLVKRAGFDNAFAFIYSKREGTLAAKLKNQVDEKIKKQRIQILLELLQKEAYQKNQEYLGKTVEVLVEEVNPKDETHLKGRTKTNKLVHFEGDKELIGQLVQVYIETAGNNSLRGKRVEHEFDTDDATIPGRS